VHLATVHETASRGRSERRAAHKHPKSRDVQSTRPGKKQAVLTIKTVNIAPLMRHWKSVSSSCNAPRKPLVPIRRLGRISVAIQNADGLTAMRAQIPRSCFSFLVIFSRFELRRFDFASELSGFGFSFQILGPFFPFRARFSDFEFQTSEKR
jgi:hypothetical protein